MLDNMTLAGVNALAIVEVVCIVVSTTMVKPSSARTSNIIGRIATHWPRSTPVVPPPAPPPCWPKTVGDFTTAMALP